MVLNFSLYSVKCIIDEDGHYELTSDAFRYLQAIQCKVRLFFGYQCLIMLEYLLHFFSILMLCLLTYYFIAFFKMKIEICCLHLFIVS